MDVSNPIRSVIPTLQGDVLAVLARTEAPLTGRGVAALIEGVSPAGVNLVLRALTSAGLVLVESHPPANLYRLNRRHLAAESIGTLATLRERVLNTMRAHLAGWNPVPWGAWLFGSAARGDGTTGSDIDVLIVRPGSVADDDTRWLAQLELFTDDVTAWTGNHCAIVELSHSEFDELLSSDQRLARDLRNDGIALTSRRLPRRSAVGTMR